MAKYEQGDAPAVLFSGDKVVFAFTCRQLECDNSDGLHEILIGAGAVCIEGAPLGQPVKAKTTEPEGFTGMTKPQIAEHIKAAYGVDIALNQSRADMMAKVAEVLAQVAGTPIAQSVDVGDEGKAAE